MQKPELTGILLQARDRIRKALGVAKHQAPDEPFYTCPYGTEDDVHRVDLDEESGQWYCMDCEAGYEDSRHLFRLDEIWREYHLENIDYEGGKPRPVRKNQKITDGELEEYFGSLEGKYVKVKILKKMFGPSPDNPDGLIKINDTDSSTTVISSSFMRRLGKITGKKWTQEKAIGEKGENLVRFVRTKMSYSPRKKPSLEERYGNLVTIEKINEKIEQCKIDLVDFFDDRGDFTEYMDADVFPWEQTLKEMKYMKKGSLEYIKSEIKYVENLEDLLGKNKPKEKVSSKMKKILKIVKKRFYELSEEDRAIPEELF